MTNVMLDHALTYIEFGWFVLPVKPRSKEPHGMLVKHGFKGATRYPQEVKRWFEVEPEINIGIACEMSGLIVLDFDYRNLKLNAFMLSKFTDIDTYRVDTGDGFHLYFDAPKGLVTVPGKMCDGIDIKYRGFVVASPSIHKNGKRYQGNDAPIIPINPALLYSSTMYGGKVYV